ncbi:MarR family winged helix-turn-helix transcriptional regulator [Catenuloplanes atrovinosus]|uniref:DNA-binding MarR family transcriptional regulator n=1 Tax=Catenuloplanes atrovinosus TaxID=137266 RepID=A0AAE4CBP8_9ACTN|nr:MarR family transcriptional regulator [Catenuloplanes atrovinosus]MDR7277154.1 DNA-binding MarR family transcriptional regulator [Catenuloplanes atrovinosus]
MTEHGSTLESVDPATSAVQALVNASNDLAARQARRLGLTVTDVQALYLLQTRGPLGAAELSRLLGISANATTALIDRLAGAGHIARETHPTDRRRVLVRILDAARDRSTAAWLPTILAVDDVARALSPDDRATVVAFLADVRAALQGRIDAEM